MASLAERQYDRILLIKSSAMGDVIHALPVLRKLRRRWPRAQIDWLVTPENAPLVRHHPDLSNVVLFDRKRFGKFGRNWSATVGLVRLLNDLRRAHYDLVLDLQAQLRSALFCLASRAPVRIGFTQTRELAPLAYTVRVPAFAPDAHAVERNLAACDLLALDREPPDFTLFEPPEAEARVQALLAAEGAANRPLALLAPGTLWETKHWTSAGFAAVGRHLHSAGMNVLVVGSWTDRGRAAAVARDCPGAIDLCGRTNLGELMVLVRRSAMCVTNDSGTMHLAAALDRPLVSLFGPTSPLRTGPYRRPESVMRLELDCSPCFLRRKRACPHDHRCLETLDPAMVIERIDALLAEQRPGCVTAAMRPSIVAS
jgi:lipopolysaccharide heptosyltransferase I